MDTRLVETASSDVLEPTEPKRVLVVENDEALLRIITEWLTRAGHDVVSFNQYQSAKSYLDTGTPNVLITDMRLGAFNGLQLVIRAKLEHPEITAIVLTGFDDPVLRKETWKAGADYLVKPITAGQLLDRMH